MLSLLFLIAVQVAYVTIIEKNHVTALAIVAIDAAIISTWLTTTGNLVALGISLLIALIVVKALELALKGMNYAQNFNPGADSNVSKPFDPNAG